MNNNDETNSNFFSGEIDLREIILVIWEKKIFNYVFNFYFFSYFHSIFFNYSECIQS